MNIVILGPQGSGKGTQAKLLCEKFNFFYFESGEFLRELAEKNEVIRQMMDRGELVPSEELASYIAAYLDEHEIYDNIIFDGFPREIEQYSFFKKWLKDKSVKIDLVFVLNVSEKVTLERLTKRGREDDTPQAIKTRLSIYRKETELLIEEFKKETKVVEIDGERDIKTIQTDLERIINEQINH